MKNINFKVICRKEGYIRSSLIIEGTAEFEKNEFSTPLEATKKIVNQWLEEVSKSDIFLIFLKENNSIKIDNNTVKLVTQFIVLCKKNQKKGLTNSTPYDIIKILKERERRNGNNC